LLPAWSNHDGYKFRNTAYRDGEKVKTLMYDRERFVPFGLLYSLLHGLTFSHQKITNAFESITQEFMTELPAVLD